MNESHLIDMEQKKNRNLNEFEKQYIVIHHIILFVIKLASKKVRLSETEWFVGLWQKKAEESQEYFMGQTQVSLNSSFISFATMASIRVFFCVFLLLYLLKHLM